jgi:hypothetical protein
MRSGSISARRRLQAVLNHVRVREMQLADRFAAGQLDSDTYCLAATG